MPYITVDPTLFSSGDYPSVVGIARVPIWLVNDCQRKENCRSTTLKIIDSTILNRILAK
jgi:hypothetical protein